MNTSENPNTIPPYIKALAISLLASAAILGSMLWYATRPPKVGGDFTLTYQGANWTFSEHKKPLTVLYIGYAKCPDICPMSLSFSAQAFSKLSEKELAQVQFVFLSVDHENDTPESVAVYASQFFPQFLGMSGSKEQIAKTVDTFKASFFVEKDPKSYLGYSIAHTDRLYFLNSKGIVVDSIPNPRSDQMILEFIRKHL